MNNIDGSTADKAYTCGCKDTFELMHDHCKHSHQVQNPDNKKEWQQCCFLIETGKFNMELWKCCYDRCPLLKG